MGGAGKTQLALEVCRQAEENSRFGAVIWVDASSPKSVIQSYRIIAQKILKHQSYNLDAEDTLCLQVRDALQDWNRLWLIIFDNYDNPQAFKGHSITNYVPTGKSGRILFTSRHQDSARLGHKIDASTMTEDESLKLLIQRLPLSEDESIHGRKIVSTLGYLALALDQAGAYIRARSLNLQEFIQHYNDRKEVVLQEIPDQWEYGRAIDDEERETKLRIFTTWELSFNQISGQEHEIKDKEHFLTLAAFFDAGSISERYFQAYFNKSNPDWMEIFSSGDRWDSYKLGDVLSEFQKLSLLQKRSPANEGLLISIHPVICDWIRLRKSPEVQHDFAAELTAALTDYLEDTDFDALSLGTKQETVRHIDSCILGDKTLSGHILDTLPRSMGLFAYFYSEQGRYNESEDLCKRALVVCKEKLGATHLDTLRTMETQAINYLWLGQYDEAERLHEQILFEFENMFGGMHSATLAAVIPLGVTYVSQGRYVEAERFLERALRGCEDTWGLTHTRTLVVVVSLAVVYKEQGRYDEAETLCKRALVGQEQELGVENPSTLLSVEILAIVYRRKGRYDEAETLYKRALSGNRENFGETHPRTLGTMHNLAITYNDQDRYDEAKQLLEQVLDAYMKTLGANHPDTLETMYTLADTYYHQGRYIEAKDLFEPALAKYIETLGATHSKTLKVTNDLAICYGDLGQHKEAEELEKRYPSTYNQ